MTRADAHAELRERTGVQFLGARFYEPFAGALDWQGKPKKATWVLSFIGPLPGADPRVQARTMAVEGSATFRKPDLFNTLMWKCGRDESLPRLTAEDGRRVLALLRELAGVEVPR